MDPYLPSEYVVNVLARLPTKLGEAAAVLIVAIMLLGLYQRMMNKID